MSSSSSNISVGSDNVIGATNTFIFGNNVNANTSNLLYLDSTIEGINSPGLFTTIVPSATYGLVATNDVLSLGMLSGGGGTVKDATPVITGIMYGTTPDNATASNYNVGLGYGALKINNNGIGNTALGSYALADNDQGTYNTAIGALAMGNSINTGVQNTALGYYAMGKPNGSNNTGLGYAALTNITGSNNVCVGDSITEVISNTLGVSQTTTVGSSNNPGSQTTSITGNITIGYNNTIGATNTIIIGNNIVGGINEPNTLYLDPTITNLKIAPGLTNQSVASSTDVIVPLAFDATTGNVYRGDYVTVSYTGSQQSGISNGVPSTTLAYSTRNIDRNSVNSNSTYSTEGVFTAPLTGWYEYSFSFAFGVAQTSSYIDGSTAEIIGNGEVIATFPIYITTTTMEGITTGGETTLFTYGTTAGSMTGIVNLTSQQTLYLQFVPGPNVIAGDFDFYPGPGMRIRLLS